MYKKKSLFITFEGIEGSGKSYQARKLYKKLKRKNISSILTREPGGTGSAEKIREVILKDYFHPKSIEKFNKYTDTLLYLAARNEHLENKIRPAILNKKIIICNRGDYFYPLPNYENIIGFMYSAFQSKSNNLTFALFFLITQF